MPDELAKHTPGPWVYAPETRSYLCPDLVVWTSEGPGNGLIAHCCPFCDPNDKNRPELAANARLISAAPELLESLEIVLEEALEIPLSDPAWSRMESPIVRKALAAIAKARGLEPKPETKP